MAGGASAFGLSAGCGFSGLGNYKPDPFAYSSNHLVCVQFFGRVMVHLVSLSSLPPSFPHQPASQSYTWQSVSALWAGSLRGGLTFRSRRTATPPLNSSVSLQRTEYGSSTSRNADPPLDPHRLAWHRVNRKHRLQLSKLSAQRRLSKNEKTVGGPQALGIAYLYLGAAPTISGKLNASDVQDNGTLGSWPSGRG